MMELLALGLAALFLINYFKKRKDEDAERRFYRRYFWSIKQHRWRDD